MPFVIIEKCKDCGKLSGRHLEDSKVCQHCGSKNLEDLKHDKK